MKNHKGHTIIQIVEFSFGIDCIACEVSIIKILKQIHDLSRILKLQLELEHLCQKIFFFWLKVFFLIKCTPMNFKLMNILMIILMFHNCQISYF
jgi:hypothetical protein